MTHWLRFQTHKLSSEHVAGFLTLGKSLYSHLASFHTGVPVVAEMAVVFDQLFGSEMAALSSVLLQELKHF